MTDSAGNSAGTLTLTADNIWVASQSILDQLNADPNFSGRDAALAANNGTANPDGFVGRGRSTPMSDRPCSSNSNTADAPGGLTVGDGGLTVTNTGATPATVVAYGSQKKSDGTTVSGADFFNAVTFGGRPAIPAARRSMAVASTTSAAVPNRLRRRSRPRLAASN